MERSIAIKMEERVAIKRYIMNLRDEISIQVQPLRPTSFPEAQQLALEAEAWHRERLRIRVPKTVNPIPRPNFAVSSQPQKFPHQSNSYSATQINRPSAANKVPNHSMPLQQRAQMTCFNCKKIGHVQSQCPSRPTQDFPAGQYNRRPPQRVHTIEEQEEASNLNCNITGGDPEETNKQNEYPLYPEEDYNQQSSEETDWETLDYWSTQGHQ